jgi:hypothetical protein
MVLSPLIQLHATGRPVASSGLLAGDGEVFAADGGIPVCHGCDRTEFAPARDALYPCRTTRALGEQLLDLADPYDESHALAVGAPSPPVGPALHLALIEAVGVSARAAQTRASDPVLPEL